MISTHVANTHTDTHRQTDSCGGCGCDCVTRHRPLITATITQRNELFIILLTGATRNSTVPKIITKWHSNFFYETAMGILVISNHSCFRVLFDKTASVYFIGNSIVIFWQWKWPAQGTGTVPIVSAHFRSVSAREWACTFP